MAGLQKILVGQRDNFFFVEIAGSNFELHVDGVGVADGDRVLRPAELDLPNGAERIGPGFKRAIVFDHAFVIVAAISPVVQGGGWKVPSPSKAGGPGGAGAGRVARSFSMKDARGSPS